MRFLSYWILPVISAAMWIAMLLAMLIYWLANSRPHYPSMEARQRTAYISDVGAYDLKPLFITGNVITTVFLDLALVAERYLRHRGRLAPNTSRTQKILSVLSIVLAVAGSAGLILLGVFDTFRYPNLHDGFLLLFIAGYLFSAIFLCAEYQRLGVRYRRQRVLRISFWVKLAFILLEVALAVAFAATSYTHTRNVGAVLEWVVAFIFAGYILSFVLDLWPSVSTKRQTPQGLAEEEQEEEEEVDTQREMEMGGRNS